MTKPVHVTLDDLRSEKVRFVYESHALGSRTLRGIVHSAIEDFFDDLLEADPVFWERWEEQKRKHLRIVP